MYKFNTALRPSTILTAQDSQGRTAVDVVRSPFTHGKKVSAFTTKPEREERQKRQVSAIRLKALCCTHSTCIVY